MNPVEFNAVENERQTMLGQLQTAEATLRSTLQNHHVDASARAHMERALAHVRVASVAIREAHRARTWDQLLSELLRMENLCRQLRRQPSPGVHVHSMHR